MNDAFTADDYGEWGRRFGAWIVDSIIFMISFSFALLAFAILLNGGEVHLHGDEYLVPLIAFSLLWEVGWIAGMSGKPGHRLLGMRIRALDGTRVSVKLATVRWLVRSTNVVFFGLEAIGSAITIAATGRRQAVHDIVASTVAVRPAAIERIAGPFGQVDASPAPATQTRGPFL